MMQTYAVTRLFLSLVFLLIFSFASHPCWAQEQTAPSKLPQPTAEQMLLFREANRFRKLMGLPSFTLNLSLCASAQAHCRYSYENPGESHYETQGKKQFRGVTPTDRAASWGYSDIVSEDMSFGGFIEEAVAGLIEAPYHRVLFMQPGSPDFGCGYYEGIVTLDFGNTERKEWVVYPAKNQQDVPLTFTGNEVPDPLRLHRAKLPAGFIIILVITGETEKFTVVSASLTMKNGADVPHYINTPETDEYLNSGVFLIPHKPLLPLTEYTASVTFRRSDDTETSVMWSFKTSKETALPPIGIKSPRKANSPTSARSKQSGGRRTKPSSRS